MARKRIRTGVLSVGEGIALARLSGDLTQGELADKLGVSKRAVQEWESNRISGLKHVNKIEQVTGKPAGWIMERVDPFEKILQMFDMLEEVRDTQTAILTLLRQRS
jgi:transcriptional regulator with XRE-family HTH domain